MVGRCMILYVVKIVTYDSLKEPANDKKTIYRKVSYILL